MCCVIMKENILFYRYSSPRILPNIIMSHPIYHILVDISKIFVSVHAHLVRLKLC